MIPGPYRNLALIGFMGAGKSAAASVLAERLHWRAVDADAEIEREAYKPIRDIFTDDGEPAFRALEERVVMRLLHETGVVVALGGGAITSPLIRERLRDGSFTVLLDVSPQTAWRRIEAQAGDRPLAAEARGFAELYDNRRGLYHATADALVDAEEVQGEEALLAPLARPSALAELSRLIGARRAALVADRSVLRMVGAPCEPFVTVRLPVGEAAKTVAVARQAWTRLGEFGLERGDVIVGMGGGAATDLAGFVAADLPPRHPLDRGADLARGHGGRGHRRQDRHRPAVGQERGRVVPPARVGGVRPGRARDPAGARMGLRLRRGDQDRAPLGRAALGDGA